MLCLAGMLFFGGVKATIVAKGMPDGGTEIEFPVPIVTLDLPVPNLEAMASAGSNAASVTANKFRDMLCGCGCRNYEVKRCIPFTKEVCEVKKRTLCKTLPVKKCKDELVKKCHDYPSKECEEFPVKSCITRFVQKCKPSYKGEEECESVPEEKCSHTKEKQCKSVTKTKCEEKKVKKCEVVQEKKCSELPKRTCKNVPSIKPTKIQVRECSQCTAFQDVSSNIEYKKHCEKVKLPKCYNKPQEVCTDSRREVCKTSYVPVCTEAKYGEQQCHPEKEVSCQILLVPKCVRKMVKHCDEVYEDKCHVKPQKVGLHKIQRHRCVWPERNLVDDNKC